MTTPIFIFSAVGLLVFAMLSIVTSDLFRKSRANRKAEAASLTKRQHDAAVAAFASILREAILLGRKK